MQGLRHGFRHTEIEEDDVSCLADILHDLVDLEKMRDRLGRNLENIEDRRKEGLGCRGWKWGRAVHKRASRKAGQRKAVSQVMQWKGEG